MADNKDFSDRVIGGLEGWRRLTEAMERTLVDNLAATAPWLAPLAPAFLAYKAMLDVLLFPRWVALAMGVTVELLGISTINTTLTFWSWNKKKNKSEASAPTWLAGLVALFYLIVVLVVNVMLDAASPVERAAKGLLSSLSAAAALTLALRAQHGQRLEEAKQGKIERRETRREARMNRAVLQAQAAQAQVTVKVAENASPEAKVQESFPMKFKRWQDVPYEERLKIARMTVDQVIAMYGVQERTAYNWMRAAKKEQGVVGEVASFQDEMFKTGDQLPVDSGQSEEVLDG